jgi:hypothetical protein
MRGKILSEINDVAAPRRNRARARTLPLGQMSASQAIVTAAHL